MKTTDVIAIAALGVIGYMIFGRKSKPTESVTKIDEASNKPIQDATVESQEATSNKPLDLTKPNRKNEPSSASNDDLIMKQIIQDSNLIRFQNPSNKRKYILKMARRKGVVDIDGAYARLTAKMGKPEMIVHNASTAISQEASFAFNGFNF